MSKQVEDAEIIKDAIQNVVRLIKNKKIENPSDEKLLLKSIEDYKTIGEFEEGTLKWFNSIIERKGAKYNQGN